MVALLVPHHCCNQYCVPTQPNQKCYSTGRHFPNPAKGLQNFALLKFTASMSDDGGSPRSAHSRKRSASPSPVGSDKMRDRSKSPARKDRSPPPRKERDSKRSRSPPARKLSRSPRKSPVRRSRSPTPPRRGRSPPPPRSRASRSRSRDRPKVL
jgi:hypothetical protein